MNYCVWSKSQLLFLKSTLKDKSFEFVIHSLSDSDYMKNPYNKRSISGIRVFLEGYPIMFKNRKQKFVYLWLRGAELHAGVTCALDVLYAMKELQTLVLNVTSPMLLEMNNRGAVDSANTWSIGEHTRHIHIKQCFLCELKEKGLFHIEPIPGDENDADHFTKNLPGPAFEKHIQIYCGAEEYDHQEKALKVTWNLPNSWTREDDSRSQCIASSVIIQSNTDKVLNQVQK